MTVFEELGKLEANKNVIPSDCLTFSEAASYVIEFTDSEYNKLFEAVGIEELAVYESTGSQIIYEAGKLEELKNKVINFIKRIWQAVKDFFTRIIGYFMTNKHFHFPNITAEDVNKYAADKKYGVISDWAKNSEAFGKNADVAGKLTKALNSGIDAIKSLANTQLNDDGSFKDGKSASTLASTANEVIESNDKAIYKDILGEGEVSDIAAFKKAYRSKFTTEKSIEVDKKWLADHIEGIVKRVSDRKEFCNRAKELYNGIKKVTDDAIKTINETYKDAKMAAVAQYATKVVGNIMKLAQAISGVYGDMLRKCFGEEVVLAVRAYNAVKAGKAKAEKEGKKEEAPKAEEKKEEAKEEKKEEKTNESVDLTASFIDEAFNW